MKFATKKQIKTIGKWLIMLLILPLPVIVVVIGIKVFEYLRRKRDDRNRV